LGKQKVTGAANRAISGESYPIIHVNLVLGPESIWNKKIIGITNTSKTDIEKIVNSIVHVNIKIVYIFPEAQKKQPYKGYFFSYYS